MLLRPSQPAASISPNIASHLPVLAATQPFAPAVIFPHARDRRTHRGRVCYTHLTYAQLNTQSNAIARGLREVGVVKGTRVVLMVTPSLDFFALVFALFKVGAVMVCVDPGLGVKNLGKCLAEARPGAFIGIPKAHLARRALRWAVETNRLNILVGRRWSPFSRMLTLDDLRRRGEKCADIPADDTQPDDPAAILFTSGSTGPPKGVVYTHANFQAQVAALKGAYNIQPGEIDLATFPLFALYAPALGMTAVIPDMDFTRPGRVDPRKVAEPIENFGVTNLFGSPALLDRVSRWAVERGVVFPSLRRVISAGAPVPARVIERTTRLLSGGAQVHTPYGATESLPVSTIASDDILSETRYLTDQGRGVCVGLPVGEADVRIIRISDDPIERWSHELALHPGQVGEIVVRGPAVTAAYFGRDEATRLAKVQAEDGFFHRMGDVGYFDEKGRLWFCGRKSHRLRLTGGDRFTIPCEAVFNTHPAVYRSALVAVPTPAPGARGSTLKPVICVELDPERHVTDRETLMRELTALARAHPHTHDIDTFLVHPAFPVDIRHNAKINREQLAIWAARKLR